MTIIPDIARDIIAGRCADPFRYLGPHIEGDQPVVRAFLPHAQKVAALHGSRQTELTCIHRAGLFAGPAPDAGRRYRLRATFERQTIDIDDPYRFAPILSDFDLHLLGEGNHLEFYRRLGAHPLELDGVAGAAFAVLAPNAQRVSVVGDFNDWDGRRHAMRRRPHGYWEIFVPGAQEGQRYKYEIVGPDGALLPLKADPVAFAAEMRPMTASIIVDDRRLRRPDRLDRPVNALNQPMSIYEVHLGSWRRNAGDKRWLTYRELAEQLPAYVSDMGFTHVELLPVTEHPFDGSWGYQPTGLFAPTSRFGGPDDFAALVEAFHKAGIGVMLDWVPGHFPDDPHGLARFDGTALYEHEDPRQGRHPDWGTLIYNYARTEVQNFLLANALFWFDRYGIDALRVDAVASMIYLDYSRPEGGWIPNEHGGRENLAAIAFLRSVNRHVFARFPQATTAAEESTAFPLVSRPTDWGGLGFGYKWNMGWMHDTLQYMSEDPIHRKHHHDKIRFGLHYAFSENFILPLSHDEVVHGKRSVLGRMPGDRWQRFANLRAYYSFMFAHPGKKLMFMGSEFAQDTEWAHDHGLPWHLLDDAAHAGVQRLVRDLNALHRSLPALHELDCDPEGFEWLVRDDADRSVFAWLRKGRATGERCIVVVNFTPEIRRGYRIRAPFAGKWREVLNSDAAFYGGSNAGNEGAASAIVTAGSPELSLVLPPLAAIYLVPEI